MVLYVKKADDKFWHWCKNCSKYPELEDISETMPQKPAKNLCPECYGKKEDKDCENGKSDNKTGVATTKGVFARRYGR
ncbi:hypothetical protein [Methanobacterium formicicum]|uniref:Uncharacterized protein n=1 Tax=Methanobacterium formicicum TaxID=2162 RepID=A0A090I1F8_METFO|nr:hypothetical protein [Methanobacterium formicicum]MDH2659762.1 hypothetical protein [Methanobacterium formicicum]CEA12793.1 hypothetical protein DSM1535_0431 [Methanobacterium formicicum]